jgi:hypothetical protein
MDDHRHRFGRPDPTSENLEPPVGVRLPKAIREKLDRRARLKGKTKGEEAREILVWALTDDP